ncbi:MAG: xylulokinase [Calditrichaceae bacterium]|nr:xylulokinase [Calditrichaceae bacterium]RQV94182.1 MAG: xylulokinase [Calditrichota bacterium]
MSIVIGIDLGTSGVKALAINEDGKILASAMETYPLFQPKAGYSEQDPADWWKGVVKVIRQITNNSGIDKKEIKAVSLSGQMHGSVFLDAKNEVIRFPLLWNDTRNHEQCRKITQIVGEERLLSMVGNPALEGFTAPKVLWLKDNEPANYSKLKTLLLPKDYINYKLTGRVCSEMSDAAGSLLLDVKNRKWAVKLAEEIGLNPEILPPVLESTDVVGEILPEVAQETGLPKSVRVIGGGADNACSAVGNGIVKESVILASLGTSGVVLAHTDQMHHDPQGRIHSFNHSVPNRWYLMGVTLSAGFSMSWLKNNIVEKDYDEINRQAAEVKPGSEGVMFLPYLAGERTPHRDPLARGVFFGLSGIHSQKHIMRSVFEGVAFALRDSLELIKNLNIKPGQIRITGGGAKSALWRQIMADVFGYPVHTMQSEEGPAFGAALIAATGAGIYKTLQDAVDQTVGLGDVTEPIKENVSRYNEIYPLFGPLYKALKEEYKKFYSVMG